MRNTNGSATVPVSCVLAVRQTNTDQKNKNKNKRVLNSHPCKNLTLGCHSNPIRSSHLLPNSHTRSARRRVGLRTNTWRLQQRDGAFISGTEKDLAKHVFSRYFSLRTAQKPDASTQHYTNGFRSPDRSRSQQFHGKGGSNAGCKPPPPPCSLTHMYTHAHTSG